MSCLHRIIFMLVIIGFLLNGCAPKPVSPMAVPVKSPIIESSLPSATPSETPKVSEQDMQKQEEEQFVNLIMQAINHNDTSIMIKYFDSIYG